MEAGINRGSIEDVQGSENIVCDTAMLDHVILHLFKPIKCTTPSVNPNIKNGLRVIRRCPWDKCSTLVGDVDGGGGCVWLEGIWNLSGPCAPFHCESKTALKN